MTADQLTQSAAILAAVRFCWKVTLAELEGPSRHTDIIWPRYIAIWLLHHDAKLNQSEVGLLMNRQPSAVHYALKACGHRQDCYEQCRKQIEDVRKIYG